MEMKKLNNDELKKVTGGFQQMNELAWSYGETITCPNCHNADESEFYCDCDMLAEVKKDLYTCAICGQKFAAAKGYGITDIL